MADRNDFLVELGTEELPPKALNKLSDAFAESVKNQLADLQLDFKQLHAFATPRRLAIRIDGLLATQPDKEMERRGPPVKIAYDDDGKPTKAAEKFAEGCGISVAEIDTIKTDKGEWLFYKGVEQGRAANELIAEVIQNALHQLPIPKRMRWGDSDVEFVRPVHWAVMLWGDQIIETELIGMPTSNKTYGHRFHAPQAITLQGPAEYPARLKEEGWVIADFDERRQLVHEIVISAAKNCGGQIVRDDELIDEITALVEWPVPVAGEFDQRYLQLPNEVLVSTLKDHQRYFPVIDKNGNTLPWFVTVSNIKSREPAEVKSGNERVVDPRLADAEFFWENDKRKTLADRIPDLEAVVFQKKLGSLAAKVDRIRSGAVAIATALGTDVAATERAASICKCDLITGMVGEFPDLQGTMGRYYALQDSEAPVVAAAMEEQYLPRFAGDALPQSGTGQALSIADKIDTIVSIFALGQKPTGTKDPFGLRRAALGVLRIIMESGLDLDLMDLIERAAAAVMPIFANDKKPAYASQADLSNTVYAYMMERLRAYFLDSDTDGIDAGMFDAVMANKPHKPLDFMHRIQAVKTFMEMPESQSLAAANKRIANILKSAKEEIPDAPDVAHLKEPAEVDLHKELIAVAKRIAPLRESHQYKESLSILAGLREPVDNFFDNVMVMDEDLKLRVNRLALLSSLREMFLHTADFSKIQ